VSNVSKRLAVVIINYRTAELVGDCLATLEGQLRPGVDEAVIVDNASGDESPQQIERLIRDRGWGSWARLVRSPVNGGFSAGNNAGMRASDAEAYLLLNSDTLVRPGAIEALLEALRQRPEAGIVSPRLLLPDGRLHVSCYRFVTPIAVMLGAAKTGVISKLFWRYQVVLPESGRPTEPQWTSFACVLIRREVVRQIGLMDEGYFMYFEDQDYCRLARKAGWKVVNWPAAVVVHLQGQSSPVRSLTAAKRRRPRYYYASRSRYYAKHYTVVGLWVTNLLWCVGRAVSLTRELLGLKQPHLCEYEWLDIWTNALRPMRRPELAVPGSAEVAAGAPRPGEPAAATTDRKAVELGRG
jgi:hypothetical protein